MKNSQGEFSDLKSSVAFIPGGSIKVPASEREPLLTSNSKSRRPTTDQTERKEAISGGELNPHGLFNWRPAASSSQPSLQAVTMDAASATSGDSSSQQPPPEQQLNPPAAASSLPPLLQYHHLLPRDRSNSQQTIPSLHTGKPYSSCDDLSSSVSYDVAASATSQPHAAQQNAFYNSSNRSSSSNRSHSQQQHPQRYSPSHHQQRNSSTSLQQQQNARAFYIYQQRLLERQHYYNNRATLMLLASSGGNAAAAQQLQAIIEDESMLEVPEEIYMVRRAALTVYRPLTRVWVRNFIIL